ncbi:acetoacetate decarboxylase family protein [Streptomyces sp. NPDC058954]|uniref:acetoacetate decarboxylase family protein n=1 Tax=Streptomyces sp. NPDC058954 TaxID=3346677 RepID=UPI0036808340
MTRYPDEPWHLAGQMYLSLWLVPRAELPRVVPGTTPFTAAGRGLVGAAWVVYENNSVLHYNELLRAVLLRDGLRPRICITDIWVDNEASLAGGRTLWGIPKEMAAFDIRRAQATSFAAMSDEGPLATGRYIELRRLPGRWPLAYTLAQTLNGQIKISPVRSSAAVRLARAEWRTPDDSRLGALSRRTPLLSLTLRDFALRFGG